jgi:hypothetical protein
MAFRDLGPQTLVSRKKCQQHPFLLRGLDLSLDGHKGDNMLFPENFRVANNPPPPKKKNIFGIQLVLALKFFALFELHSVLSFLALQ